MTSSVSYVSTWPQPLELDQAISLIRALAVDQHRGPIVLEALAQNGQVSYRLRGIGVAAASRAAGHVHGLRLDPLESLPSTPWRRAARLRLHHPARPLDAADPTESVRTVLAALGSLAPRKLVMVQIILGAGRSPFTVPRDIANPWQGWVSRALNGVQPSDGLVRSRLQARADQVLVQADVRFATTASGSESESVIRGLLAASRIIERDGPRFYLSRVDLQDIATARSPRRFPLKLTAPEVVVLAGLPVGREWLPGQAPAHPRLTVPRGAPSAEREFARLPSRDVPVGLASSESRFHSLLLGATGSGKSTTLARLACADIDAGRSVAVIDPKADTVREIAERVTASRLDDVVILDPSAADPVGFNPLDARGRDPHVVADSVVDILTDVFAPIGPRTLDVLNAAVLSLVLTKGTLVELPDLLLDPTVRRACVAQLTDPALLGFWSRFESYSPTQLLDVVGPTMSRLRRVLLRPGLRAMLGTHDGFHPDELFLKPTILLVPTNRGISGPQAASLLGSLVVASLWNRALGQAALPEARRRPVGVYVDEVATFLRLPGSDIGDALAQSRSLNVSWTLAAQFLGQCPPEMREALMTNARNKIAFALTASDAKTMASESAELTPEDFRELDTYEIYARLTRGGTPQPWFFARTIPLPTPTVDLAEVYARSRARWPARPLEDAPGSQRAQGRA